MFRYFTYTFLTQQSCDRPLSAPRKNLNGYFLFHFRATCIILPNVDHFCAKKDTPTCLQKEMNFSFTRQSYVKFVLERIFLLPALAHQVRELDDVDRRPCREQYYMYMYQLQAEVTLNRAFHRIKNAMLLHGMTSLCPLMFQFECVFVKSVKRNLLHAVYVFLIQSLRVSLIWEYTITIYVWYSCWKWHGSNFAGTHTRSLSSFRS